MHECMQGFHVASAPLCYTNLKSAMHPYYHTRAKHLPVRHTNVYLNPDQPLIDLTAEMMHDARLPTWLSVNKIQTRRQYHLPMVYLFSPPLHQKRGQ
jgi:hypothetical protein